MKKIYLLPLWKGYFFAYFGSIFTSSLFGAVVGASVQASELWMRVLVGYAVANGFFLLCVFSVAGLKYERPVLTLEERLDERRWVPTLVPDAAIPWILSLPFLPAVLIAKLFGK